MLLFPGQAVHCHLFMRTSFALPSFSFPSPTVNMEIVFVSLRVDTHASMHIFTCAFVQRSFNVCLFYCVECKLVPCLCWDAVGGGGSCGSSTERKLFPSSINKHTSSSCCSINSQSSLHTDLFSPSVSVCPSEDSHTFITTITVSCYYPFEWRGLTSLTLLPQ